MKKSTVIVTIVIFLLVTAVVGVYAILAGKARTEELESIATPVELALSRDLEKNYPATVKEVVKFYTDLQKCYYNEECTEEEIDGLGLQARALFDDELKENNPVDSYLSNLQQEVADFKSANKRLSSATVASSANVFYFEEDGFEFARIYCGYTVRANSINSSFGQVYLLRRDENKRWKIYGWAASDAANS